MIRIRLCINAGDSRKTITICDSTLLQMITRIATYCLSVAEEIGQVYKFESLAKYPLKERVMILAADAVFYIVISVIGRTIRWKSEGLEHVKMTESVGKIPIYCLWHERLFAGTYF